MWCMIMSYVVYVWLALANVVVLQVCVCARSHQSWVWINNIIICSLALAALWVFVCVCFFLYSVRVCIVCVNGFAIYLHAIQCTQSESGLDMFRHRTKFASLVSRLAAGGCHTERADRFVSPDDNANLCAHGLCDRKYTLAKMVWSTSGCLSFRGGGCDFFSACLCRQFFLKFDCFATRISKACAISCVCCQSCHSKSDIRSAGDGFVHRVC